MFPITITINNPEELQRVLFALDSKPAAAPKEKPAPKAEKPAPIPPAPETATAPQEVSAPAEAATESPSEPPAEIDFVRDISAPIVKMAGTGKREQAIEILGKFGVKKASDLKKEDYPAVLKMIKAAQ